MKGCVETPRNRTKSPLQMAALPLTGLFLCGSRTALELTPILAFWVHIQDDDICEQWGKRSPPSAPWSWHSLSFRCCIGRARGRGRSLGPARGLCHPAPGEAMVFPKSPAFRPHRPCPPADRALGLPESQIQLNLGTPGAAPSLPIHLDPGRFCQPPSWLCKAGFGSRCTSHIITHTGSKLFSVGFLAPVPYLPQGLFSCAAPLHLQLPCLKSYLGFFPFPQATAGVSGAAVEGTGTLAMLFLTCRGVAYPALRCCRSHPSLPAFPRFYPRLLAASQPCWSLGRGRRGSPFVPCRHGSSWCPLARADPSPPAPHPALQHPSSSFPGGQPQLE